METGNITVQGVIVSILFLIALLHSNKWVVRCSLIGGLIIIGVFINDLRQAPNGMPTELKADGEYQIRVVDLYTDDGEERIAVQILIEQGNTITGRLPYKYIPKSKFGNNNIIIGIPMTYELKTFASHQKLIEKKDY